MQNLAQFRSTSNFDGDIFGRNEDLQNRSSTWSTVIPPTFHELWSTKCVDLDVKSYPPKSTFSEDHISAPKGSCTTKFSHVLENDQVLLAHLPAGTGVPLKISFQREAKTGLKIWHIRACSFRGIGNTTIKLCHMMSYKVSMITYVQICGGLAPQKFGRTKTLKIRPDFGQLLTLTANILGNDCALDNRKQTYRERFLLAMAKNGWTLVH